MNAEQAWQSVLGQLQMEMPRASFDTWVRNTKPVSYQNGTLTIGVHNAYARDWLESRLASTVSRLLIGIMDASVAVNFIVNGNTMETEAEETLQLADELEPSGHLRSDGPALVYEESPRPYRASLNPRYLFETFVVGSGNRLAHA
ncbi:MAG TPA: DnaA N-terminal domain-containing protein, partial [Anaerolineales bacterium]|nr:DnaA N-terminal domain-containing protein [Anaerolineales bacterium]